MAILDLISDEGLRDACKYVERTYQDSAKDWNRELTDFLALVAAADERKRASLAFQKQLWDENPVSSVGQGNISVAHALNVEDFRNWLAKQSLVKLPEDSEARINALTIFYEEILNRLTPPGLRARTPHLKTFRVLAAFFPNDFTTIAHRWKLHKLAQRMGEKQTNNPVAWHAHIMRRLDAALGPPANSLQARAWRMSIPWYLHERVEAETPEADKLVQGGIKAGDETLLPLPAARRRRGLTAIQGGLSTVMGLLEFCKAGVTRDDLLDQILTAMPGLKESSRRTVINVLQSELGVLKRDGDAYRLTDQGLAVLESGEASELGNWLLTRILGVDHVLKGLYGKPRPRTEITELLQGVNPGWTTTFAPNALINWLVSLGAVSRQEDKLFALTPLGETWAFRIAWQPESLSIDQASSDTPLQGADENVTISLPSIDQIHSYIKSKSGEFPKSTIERLHIGLWPRLWAGASSRQFRHFAVLTGISGSGKTLLARRYAEALAQNSLGAENRVLIEAVQPGWYDPTPLLGYLNPLRSDVYTRTPFLNFLMRACQDPSKPYVVILDEMNLSHPEQYLAPLLSAMETGGAIRLHAEQEDYDGVPPFLQYPQNLAIIGTVNMDETTHGISDKVLDRAFTLEFWSIDLASYPRWGKRGIPPDQEYQIQQLLSELMDSLAPARMHFGWRVVDDVLNYVQTGSEFSPNASLSDLLDAIICAKVLPKLRGEDSKKFRSALDETYAALIKHGLTISADRVAELNRDLRETGSARFWR